MTTRIHRASKTRSNRPGWSVTFSHPRRRDARGRFGLKVRRGLGTQDAAEADRLVEQINALLADESWWSLDRRADAERQFDHIAVAAFFDGIEVGKISSKNQRETIIPLPTPDDGYARVMLLGSTGAGKTTLLRHFIGSDHKRDRFPATSTAKTTTADIEIVTAPGPFEAVITFMTEHQVRCAVDECLEEACARVIQGQDDTEVAKALLEHQEQRFRLSYILGAWRQEVPKQIVADQNELDFAFEDPTPETYALSNDEIVAGDEITNNNRRLQGYVDNIRKIATAVGQQVAAERGEFHEQTNANRRQDWLDGFTNGLYESQDFARLSLDIIDAVEERFNLVAAGDFERGAADWPTLWYCEEKDRDNFLRQVRWFTSNHGQQFGRLLTPLVDGIRVRGPFEPSTGELQDDNRKLVLMDGEGLGHLAREATSVSTRVTERFSEADMILLVDNAQSPMQAAPLELLRSAGHSGHGHKLAVVFTHFDQVQGDNLNSYDQKRNHVHASIGNAIAGLQGSLGAPVAEILRERLNSNDFYLGGLNRATYEIPGGFRKSMQDLLDRMQQSAEPVEPIDAAPIYNIVWLDPVLHHAADGFKNPWRGWLGFSRYEGFPKQHWGRIKALCRRIANRWDNDEYGNLRPKADLISQLQNGISFWLGNPSGWRRQPADAQEGQEAINKIRQRVYDRIHTLAESRLIADHISDWRDAFVFSGTGSSYRRAERMAQIYDAAAPSDTPAMDDLFREFKDEVIQIIKEAVEDAGGSLEGAGERRTVTSG